MATPVEIPVSDDNESWLNTVRRKRDGQAEDTADDADDELVDELDTDEPVDAPPADAPPADAPTDGISDPTTDEEEQISEAVAAYRAGEIPFDEALKRVAETSLTWQEAQILLADEDVQPEAETVEEPSE